jgi:hypothetical protein
MSINLSKNDSKILAIFQPYVANLQGFIDRNIYGTVSMTAATIAEKFLKQNTDCKFSQDDLVKAFRLCVNTGAITGIEGVRKAGYRRVSAGSAPKPNQPKSIDEMLKDISPYIPSIQVWADEVIQGDTRLTAQAIYEAFKKDKGCDLDENTFVEQFRIAVREDKIVGLYSARRWGYGRDDGTESEDSSSEDNGGMPKGRLNPLERAAAKPTSLRRAVTAKCWDCQGRDSDPGSKARVRDCETPKCPLYNVRPWQNVTSKTGYTDEDDDVESNEDDLSEETTNDPSEETAEE